MSKYCKLENIANAIKPMKVNGHWQKPKLSARRLARIRRECLRSGTINGVPAQWNPEWDRPKKAWIPRPPKGHADERKQAERIALIDKNMKEMPKLIEETRKEAYLSKPHTFLDIKLTPADFDAFYQIGKTMTNKQRKNDRIRAEKLAKEAEASKKAKEAAKEAAKKEKKQKEGKKEKKQQEGEVKEKKPKEEVSNASAETKSE